MNITAPIPAAPATAAAATALAPPVASAALSAAPQAAVPPVATPQGARALAERFLDALLRTTGQTLDLPTADSATTLPLPATGAPTPAAQEAAAASEDDSDALSALPLQAMAQPAPALQTLPTLPWQIAQQLQAAAAQAAMPQTLAPASDMAQANAPLQPAAPAGARTAALAIALPAVPASTAAQTTPATPTAQPTAPGGASFAQNLALDAATTADATAADASSTPLALQAAGLGRADAAQASAPADAVHRAGDTATPEQKLVQALGERLALNLQRGSERALIRLDPPLHGHLEIAIRHEAGAIQVQLTASHGDVVRQLQAISDGLRQDLQQRQGGEVSVLINSSAGDRGQDGRARQQAQPAENNEPGQALAEAEHGARAQRFGLDSSAS